MPKTAKPKTRLLLEEVYGGSLKIDKDQSVIKGVKILTPKSRNGYKYSPEAIREAIPLYEGVRVSIDHPSRETAARPRSVRDTWGTVKNVTVDHMNEMWGDLHYLTHHPMTVQLLEMAEKMPEHFGLSHNADGKPEFRGNEEVITKIMKVRSVDLVCNPATTRGLFEHEEGEDMKTKTFKISEILKAKGFSRLLEEEMPMAPMADAPVEVPEEAAVDSDIAIKNAFRTAILAVFDDESLDAAATIDKVVSLIEKYYETTGQASTDTGEGEGEPTMESLQAELRNTKAEIAVRRLLESSDVESTDDDVEILVGMNEKQRKTYVSRMPKRSAKGNPTPGTKPAISKPLMESESTVSVPKFEKTEDKIAFLRGGTR